MSYADERKSVSGEIAEQCIDKGPQATAFGETQQHPDPGPEGKVNLPQSTTKVETSGEWQALSVPAGHFGVRRLYAAFSSSPWVFS